MAKKTQLWCFCTALGALRIPINYVYIYSLVDGKPKLLAYCYTGARGYSGLYKVYGERGKLVVELLDPNKMEGECCSSGFVRTRYLWREGQFITFGAKEYGTIELQTAPDR